MSRICKHATSVTRKFCEGLGAKAIRSLPGVFLSIPALTGVSFAHDAPSGWSYPIACCSGYDCRQVSKAIVTERPEGYVISTTGEVVGYSDKRVHISEDGDYHWCSIGGKDTGSTICLFVPPRFF
jgi:hypothetical protein